MRFKVQSPGRHAAAAFFALVALAASALGPKAGEIRGVWDHFGRGLYEGDWPRTVRKLKEAGISDIYVNVAGPGFAHYDSNILPTSRLYARSGDQLAACIDAASREGMRVHAWVMCFSAGRAPEALRSDFAARGWCLKGAQGSDTYLLDPSNPEVSTMMLRTVSEISRKYEVAGIHLDYVRWRDFPSTRNTPAAMARFAQAHPDAGEPTDAALFDWRARVIGAFVAEARRRALEWRPGAAITAAVYGKYPSCVDAVGQDWVSWLETGVVDYVLPMDYTESDERFAEWTGEQARTPAQARKVIAGIGVTASESRLDAEGVKRQIAIARRAGIAGFALFDLDETLEKEILPALSGRSGESRQ